LLSFVGHTFTEVRERCLTALMDAAPSVAVGEWQSQDVSNKPEMVTRELMNVVFEIPVGNSEDLWAMLTNPNLPWAEDHFQERVSGIPHNPPPSEAWWPFAQQGNAAHKDGELFSHTYPERMWPKRAGTWVDDTGTAWDMHGIRYDYGDLHDLVTLLEKSPLTRQAYLPIWFPEDTGAVMGQRVPCTLGYQFLIRNARLNMTYHIRSCDALRHWPDDVYMAGRLMQWVSDQLMEGGRIVGVGDLVMHIGSLHIFEGDLPALEYKRAQG
jgi:thymidylate synthase